MERMPGDKFGKRKEQYRELGSGVLRKCFLEVTNVKSKVVQ